MSDRGSRVLAPRHGENEFQRHPLPGEAIRREKTNPIVLKRQAAKADEEKKIRQQQAAAAEILQRRWEQAEARRKPKRDGKDERDRSRGRSRDRDQNKEEARPDAAEGDGPASFGDSERASSPAGDGDSAASSRTVPAPTPMPKFELGRKQNKPDAAFDFQAGGKQEKRKNNLKNVFAFGADDDEEDVSAQKEEFEKAKRQKSSGTSTPMPTGAQLGVSLPSEVKKLAPAELGRRLAEFKKEQVKGGRRVFTPMPDDLRIALAECVASGKTPGSR